MSKQSLLKLSAFALACLMLSSCAQLQTRRNVTELGADYEGIVCDPPRVLYVQGGRSYVKVYVRRLEKRYPVLRDKVFFSEQKSEPSYSILQSADSEEKVSHLYLPLSASTADVLRRENGYSSMDVLMKELIAGRDQAKTSLPGAVAVPVRALVDGERSLHAFESTRNPAKPGMALQALSKLDLVFVDVPGTLLYNVAIPVIEPFVFFKRFFTEEDDGRYVSEMKSRLQSDTNH